MKSLRSSPARAAVVVIRNPDRKKKTVTPNARRKGKLRVGRRGREKTRPKLTALKAIERRHMKAGFWSCHDPVGVEGTARILTGGLAPKGRQPDGLHG